MTTEKRREPKIKEAVASATSVPRAKKGVWFVALVCGAIALGCGASVLVGVVIGHAIARRQGAAWQTAPVPSMTTWTCSMHPQIKLPKPGKCPICFMDLIPLEQDDGGDVGPRQLRMSQEAAALADVQTETVKRQYVAKLVRMVGKVDYDETRVADITAWIPGRLDRLYVDYTGITVRKGDHLFSMYSPELVVAQRELLLNSRTNGGSGTARTRGLALTNPEMTEAKLRRWGLLDEQIEEIKRRGTPSDHLTIYAPLGGIVTEKHVNEGVYVKEGTKIYTIADLTLVWVHLDAYESDVPWIRFGQEVEFSTESYPGEIFEGRIAFIDPVLNEKTRTVRVRVNVPNKGLRLKPGMFVRAMLRSQLAAGGRVLDKSLAGKWISPMHPEIVKDGPGKCDVCGMDLVPAEQLGLVAEERDPQPPLVIPASAPLITGKRAVVYVKVPDRDQPTFEGREVVLGHRAGDHYIVREGLREGEQVVVSGNFKIDSALEIQARPSMMSSAGPAPLDVPEAFRRQLSAVYTPYLKLQEALADDRHEDARTQWRAMQEALSSVPTETLDPRVGETWRQTRQRLADGLAAEPDQSGIEGLRKPFEQLAMTMLDTVATFGHSLPQPLYEAYCPMAFKNKGAPWLQAGDQIANPYFGHKMLRCGEIRRQFAPAIQNVFEKRGNSP